MTISPTMATFITDGVNVVKASLRTWGGQVETDVAASVAAAAAASASAAALDSRVGTLESVPLAGLRNRIINPHFAVSQRNGAAATTTADNAYWADRWRFLGEASGSCTGAAAGSGTYSKVGTVAMAADGTSKFGAWQVIEGVDIKALRGLPVTLSVVLSVSNARLGNMKIGIVQFTGTEDAVSGDPISAWGADGTTPTLAAGYTFLNTPANIGATTSLARYSVTATVGASANNLAVFIWNDDKAFTAADSFSITEVQLIPGSTTPLYAEHRPLTVEIALCQRYFARIGGEVANDIIFGGYNLAGGGTYFTLALPVKMRAVPSATVVGTWTVSNCGQPSITAASSGTVSFVSVVTVSSAFNFQTSGTTTYLTVAAEL